MGRLSEYSPESGETPRVRREVVPKVTVQEDTGVTVVGPTPLPSKVMQGPVPARLTLTPKRDSVLVGPEVGRVARRYGERVRGPPGTEGNVG